MNINEYLKIVESIRGEIHVAQYKVAVSVNRELIMLYYNIVRVVNEHESWGNKFIDNLATDIKLSFPNTTGYSVKNLKCMAEFVATYSDEDLVQTLYAQSPWSYNVALLDNFACKAIDYIYELFYNSQFFYLSSNPSAVNAKISFSSRIDRKKQPFGCFRLKTKGVLL